MERPSQPPLQKPASLTHAAAEAALAGRGGGSPSFAGFPPIRQALSAPRDLPARPAKAPFAGGGGLGTSGGFRGDPPAPPSVITHFACLPAGSSLAAAAAAAGDVQDGQAGGRLTAAIGMRRSSGRTCPSFAAHAQEALCVVVVFLVFSWPRHSAGSGGSLCLAAGCLRSVLKGWAEAGESKCARRFHYL